MIIKYTNYIIVRLGALMAIIAMMCLVSQPAWAQQIVDTQQAQYIEVVSAVKQKTKAVRENNKLARQQLEALRKKNENLLALVSDSQVDSQVLDQVILETSLAQAALEGKQIGLTEAQQLVSTSNIIINQLENELHNTALAAGESSVVRARLSNLQQQLAYQRELLKARQQYVDVMSKGVETARLIYQQQLRSQEQLGLYYQTREMEQRQQALLDAQLVLEQQQQQWLEKLTGLNAKLQTLDPESEDSYKLRLQYQLEIVEAQEQSNLIHLELVLLRLENQVAGLEDTSDDDKAFSSLNISTQEANVLLNQVNNVQQLIQRKISQLQDYKNEKQARRAHQYISETELQRTKALIDKLLVRYEQYAQQVNIMSVRVKDVRAQLQKEMNRALSRRQGMPGLSLDAWYSLGMKLTALPQLAIQAGKAMWSQAIIAFTSVSKWGLISLLAVELLLLLGWLRLRKLVANGVGAMTDSKPTLTRNISLVSLQLIKHNLTGLYLFVAFLALIWLTSMTFKLFSPVIYLVIVYFIFKFALNLARFTLVDTVADIYGRDVKLYGQLRWVLIGGGILTMLTVLSYQLPVAYEVSDFFNRLFMLFMLIISFVLLREWKVVPSLLSHYVESPKPYIMRVVRLLSFLIPLTILSTAAIGLFGYVDLAWTISKHEGLFLLVLSGYVVVRGFYIDFMEWLSEYFIRRLRNGWLLTQSLLRPLDKVLRIMLVIAAIFTLFTLYGWGADSYVVGKIYEILHYNIITFEEISITLLGLIQFAVAAAILFWLAKWTREFSYRWMFAKTRDLGLRNSFAAFTQYAMVILGLFVALKVIGVDLTGLSYILTALAIGVGFGLRDLAKNYICGMLLLIERPVRSGDLISVGNFDGEVTDIGMRTLTIKTWDHIEVLVPNSELFEKPFMNWTHQDSIVRTVITIMIHRDDDAIAVRDIIMGVLDDINEVVTEPEPQVFMKEINEALVQVELRYFINLQLKGVSRARVRSKVLFALWQAFKDNGIKPPYQQQELYLRAMPDSPKAQ